MAGYLAPFIATFVVVFLLSRIASAESAWRQRLPSLGFMLAAVIWLTVGALQSAVLAMGLGIVFFSLAVSLGGHPSPFFRQHEKR